MVRSNHSGLAYYTFVNSPVKGGGQIGGLMWCHEFIPLLASSSASSASATSLSGFWTISLHRGMIWREACLVEEQKANCFSLQDLLHLVHECPWSNHRPNLSRSQVFWGAIATTSWWRPTRPSAVTIDQSLEMATSKASSRSLQVHSTKCAVQNSDSI